MKLVNTKSIYEFCKLTFYFDLLKLKTVSDNIAFYSTLTGSSPVPPMPEGSTIIFNEVLLNEGDGWVIYLKHNLISLILLL